MSMPGAYAAGDGGPFSECEGCGAQVRGTPEYDSYGHPMPVLCDECEEKERRAWDADERDMSRIAREWAEYDRDKPDLPLEPTAAELTGPYAVLNAITLDYGAVDVRDCQNCGKSLTGDEIDAGYGICEGCARTQGWIE